MPGGGSAGYHTLIVLSIAMVAVLFVGMIGVIYYKSWLAGPTASALLLVVGTDKFDGAEVSVDQIGGALRSERLQASNEYVARFPLPAGSYTVEIRLRGELVDHQPVKVGDYQIATITLGDRDQSEKAKLNKPAQP